MKDTVTSSYLVEKKAETFVFFKRISSPCQEFSGSTFKGLSRCSKLLPQGCRFRPNILGPQRSHHGLKGRINLKELGPMVFDLERLASTCDVNKANIGTSISKSSISKSIIRYGLKRLYKERLQKQPVFVSELGLVLPCWSPHKFVSPRYPGWHHANLGR